MNFFIYFLGFVRGAVPRKDNALAMGVAVFSSVLFSLLLRGGFWLLGDVLPFGWTRAETIVYWVFAVLSLLYTLPQIPLRVRKAWRLAMIPGSVEADILEQRVGARGI